MKLYWGVAAAVVAAAPIMALPTRWSADRDPGITRYTVGDLGRRGSHIVIACPQGRGADISVAVEGIIAPSSSDIGFRAANRTVVMRSNGNGLIETRTRANAAAFAALWQAIRAGSTLEVSFTNGVSAKLPLTGSARALPAAPCPADHGSGRLDIDI